MFLIAFIHIGALYTLVLGMPPETPPAHFASPRKGAAKGEGMERGGGRMWERRGVAQNRGGSRGGSKQRWLKTEVALSEVAAT